MQNYFPSWFVEKIGALAIPFVNACQHSVSASRQDTSRENPRITSIHVPTLQLIQATFRPLQPSPRRTLLRSFLKSIALAISYSAYARIFHQVKAAVAMVIVTTLITSASVRIDALPSSKFNIPVSD